VPYKGTQAAIPDLLTGGVPCYGVYPTKDGRWLAVGALEEKFWRAVCSTIDRPDLVAGGLATGAEGARVRAELEAVFGARTQAEWIGRFRDVDACVTPVLALGEALDDEQFAARGMVVHGADGSRSYGPPWKLSRHDFRVEREAPAQGQHTCELLREAGYSPSSIRELVRYGFAAGPLPADER
jgi:crotonobetainyl-CoA:carnitine CoA-transferase CaiB-like acyl-CoA transferase